MSNPLGRYSELVQELVTSRFSEAAAHYDEFAHHQAEIATQLASLLPRGAPPANIVEIGSGTGLFTQELWKSYPQAKIKAVDLAKGMMQACAQRYACYVEAMKDSSVAQKLEAMEWIVADGEQYSAEPAVDMIASSCAVQWFKEPKNIARHFASYLAPGGWVVLAVPLEGTLHELSWAVEQALQLEMPTVQLAEEAMYRQEFSSADWVSAEVWSEDVTHWYDHPRDVLRHVKRIGASCSRQRRWSPLTVGELHRMMSIYSTRFEDASGRVPCTYRVVYILAQRAE